MAGFDDSTVTRVVECVYLINNVNLGKLCRSFIFGIYHRYGYYKTKHPFL